MLHKLFCALLADDVRCGKTKRFLRFREKKGLCTTSGGMRALIEGLPHKNVAITPWLTHVASAQASDPGVSTMPQASTFAASRGDLGDGLGVSGLEHDNLLCASMPALGVHFLCLSNTTALKTLIATCLRWTLHKPYTASSHVRQVAMCLALLRSCCREVALRIHPSPPLPWTCSSRSWLPTDAGCGIMFTFPTLFQQMDVLAVAQL